MLKEILKIKPQLDNNDLAAMDRQLNKRFAGVAKKFGSGLKAAVIGGGLAALGAGVISKLLNPLKEAEGIFNNLLNRGDDAVTNAEDLGTTSGKLLRLQGVAGATGLDPEMLNGMLTKFQTSLAEERQAAKDPNSDKGTLRNFIDEKDTVDAFINFMKSLKQVDDTRKILAETEIFGEKIRGKSRDFLNLKNIDDILAKLPGEEDLTAAANKTGALGDLRDELQSIQGLRDFAKKASIASEKMVQNQSASNQLTLDKENKSLKQLDSFKPTSIAIQELTNKFDDAMLSLTKEWAPPLVEGIKNISKASDEILKKLAVFSELLSNGHDRFLERLKNILSKIPGFG